MRKRPLSPHLSVYNLPLAARMSIMHRITGAIMFGCLSFLCWYFILETFYGIPCGCCFSLVYIFQILAGLSFFYHISTGVRHLIWDAGFALSKERLIISGIACIVVSIAMSYWFWFL